MSGGFDTASWDISGILPAQMSVGVRWNGDTSGPRALMLAVLEDAVRCIETGRRSRRFNAQRLAADAEAWVRSENRDWPFAFVNICEVLGLDTDALRKRLSMMRNDASDRRSVRLRAPMRIHALTLVPEPRRASAGGV